MNESIFSKQYEVTPDVGRYLKRIGYSDAVEISLDCLNKLCECHQKTVPFENVDVYKYHLPVILDIEHLYDKIVLNRRGGYCFENNTSFLSLLRGIGFDARPCMCRIIGDPTRPIPNIRHKGTIVTLDGREYYVDVGAGGTMCANAVPICEGGSASTNGETFRFENCEANWWYLIADSPIFNSETGIIERKERPVVMVSTHICAPEDFVPYNNYCCQPGSRFYEEAFIYIRQDNGFAKLDGNRFVVVSSDGIQRKELKDSEVDGVLKEVFGIEVKGEYLRGFSDEQEE